MTSVNEVMPMAILLASGCHRGDWVRHITCSGCHRGDWVRHITCSRVL